MKYIKSLFIGLWVRIIMWQLKRGAVNSETVLRILLHYTLISMREQESEKITIEYEEETSPKNKLLIDARVIKY